MIRSQITRAGNVDSALIALAAGLAAVLIALSPHEMSPDGWYALLGGDVVVHHGLPSHDSLTVWGHGRRWVDQQWAAQLISYGLYVAGGLRLVLITNAAVVAGAFGGAIAAARGLGATARNTFAVGVIGAVAAALSSNAFRPQTLVLPLFVTLVWLLVSDARRPSRRVFLVVPILVAWANLHGSVTLAALLVFIASVCSAVSRRAPSMRDGSLALFAIVAPFASPYAPYLLGYYRAILFNSNLAQYVPDWMPTGLGPETLAFYLLAFGALAVLARAPRSMTMFERVSIVLLLILAVQASRGITWFAFAAVVIVPSARGENGGTMPVLGRRLRGPLASGSVVAVLAAVAFVLLHPEGWLDRAYPAPVAAATVAAAGREARVFANGAYADWLLLREPALRGRVAYDARFEVLPDGRLADAADVSIGRWDSSRILAPFDVVVLSPGESQLRAVLARSGGWRRVAAASDAVVLRRVIG